MIFKDRQAGAFTMPIHGFKITFRGDREAYPEIVDDFNKNGGLYMSWWNIIKIKLPQRRARLSS